MFRIVRLSHVCLLTALVSVWRPVWASDSHAEAVDPHSIDSQAASSLTLQNDIEAVALDASGNVTSNTVCIPDGTQVQWRLLDNDTAHVSLRIVGVANDTTVKDCTAGRKNAFVAESVIYHADASDIRSAGNSEGIAIGLLAIPYKWYVKGDNAIASNVTGGGYVGYQWHFSSNDTNLLWVAIGGLGTVQVPVAGNGTSTQSEPSVTLGTALLGSGGDGTGTQYGIAFGWDFVADSVKWHDNAKLWIAFQVGYKWR